MKPFIMAWVGLLFVGAEMGWTAESALAAALKDPSREVRFYAACALVLVEPGNESARVVLRDELPALTRMLDAKDEESRLLGAAVLGTLGAEAKEAVPALFRAEGITKRSGAAIRDAVEQIGPAAVPFLGKAVKDGTEAERSNAVYLLARIGPQAKDRVIPALTPALGERNGHARLTAAVALKELEPGHTAALRTLNEMAQDAKDRELRLRAMWALGRHAAVWVEVLKDPRDVRAAPIEATLGLWGEVSVTLVPAGHNRFTASRALGRIGPDARTVVPDLVEALKGPDGDIRFYAACALIQIAPEDRTARDVLKQRIPALIEMLGDGPSERVVFAANVLGNLGADAEAALPALATAGVNRQDAIPQMAAEAARAKIRLAIQVPQQHPEEKKSREKE